MTPRYLLDKSALRRMHREPVREVLAPLIQGGEIATCPIIEMEVLYSARTREEYRRERANRAVAYESVSVTDWACRRALEVQAILAEQAKHRGASIPDLLIAACAEEHRLTVLHYDADYELIASVTGQQVEWVVPKGTVP